MTTKDSPEADLRRQSDMAAKTLKMMEKSDHPARTTKEMVRSAMAMDDKLLTFELPWETVKEYSEEELSAFILKLMQEKNDKPN